MRPQVMSPRPRPCLPALALQELDDAVRRRMVKRIYIPLPDAGGRAAILGHLLKGQAARMGADDLARVVK